MLISRETDYALRILRSLLEGERKPVGMICKDEMIPQQFAYKIMKKLSRAGLVEITRGADGGCRLSADLAAVSLYDLMVAMEDRCAVNACMDPAYECSRRIQQGGCVVHTQLALIQKNLDNELRAHDLKTILTGR